MGTAAKQFVGLRLQMKWRLEDQNEDPGGWTNVLFHAARSLGEPDAPLTAHKLYEEIENGIPSLKQKQKHLAPDQTNKVKAAPAAWGKLDKWLERIGAKHPDEIFLDNKLPGESKYQLDPLTNRVSDFAGHVWLIRETTIEDDYRHTDFLPDFQTLRQSVPPARSLADFLEYYIFPLRSKKGVLGKPIHRNKIQEDAEPIPWHNDRAMGDPKRSREILVPLSPERMTGVLLPTGNYGFKTDPRASIHNCLTWASTVLKLKSNGWFCKHFNGLPPKDMKELHECFFMTGHMKDAYEILFNGNRVAPSLS